MNSLTVALIQTDAKADKDDNVEAAYRYVEQAARAGAQLVTLPENFHVRAGENGNQIKLDAAEPIPGPMSQRFSELARTHEIFLLAGSYGERTDTSDRIYNTSLLFDPQGRLIAKYRKIHLFDVTVGDHVVARESSRVLPGSETVTADTAFGRVGLSICYDVRFPELYRSLAVSGAVACFVPANFTLYTGKDHWEVLLRARAVENGVYVIAPAQIGKIPNGHESYGRSMIVDPRGTVVACAPDRPGVTIAEIDLDAVSEVRARIPSLEHRVPDAYST